MKPSLRKNLLDKRLSLSGSYIAEQSEKICSKAMELCKNVNSIMAYSPIRNEVQTEGIIKAVLRDHKELILPKVIKKKIVPVKVTGAGKLKEGKYAVLEPLSSKPCPIDRIGLAFIPGIGFDREGYRIGFGCGYYDKFLSNFKGEKVGLAFCFQLVRKVPHEKHDIPVDIVITEKAVVRCRHRKIYKQ